MYPLWLVTLCKNDSPVLDRRQRSSDWKSRYNWLVNCFMVLLRCDLLPFHIIAKSQGVSFKWLLGLFWNYNEENNPRSNFEFTWDPVRSMEGNTSNILQRKSSILLKNSKERADFSKGAYRLNVNLRTQYWGYILRTTTTKNGTLQRFSQGYSFWILGSYWYLASGLRDWKISVCMS